MARFVVGVLTVAKHVSIPDEKRHRHEHAIAPELPLTTFAGRVPKSAVFGAWISIESLPDAIGSEFVFWFSCLLVKNQQQIARKHAVEIVKLHLAHFALRIRAGDNAVCVDV